MNAKQIEQCRAEFEVWVSRQNVCKKYGAKLHKHRDGSYRDYRINDRWNAWKAATASQLSSSQSLGFITHAQMDEIVSSNDPSLHWHADVFASHEYAEIYGDDAVAIFASRPKEREGTQ